MPFPLLIAEALESQLCLHLHEMILPLRLSLGTTLLEIRKDLAGTYESSLQNEMAVELTEKDEDRSTS